MSHHFLIIPSVFSQRPKLYSVSRIIFLRPESDHGIVNKGDRLWSQETQALNPGPVTYFIT